MDKKLERSVARRGLLRVNLPIFFIIFGCWLTFLNFDILTVQTAALVSGAIGWIYWEFAIVKWIRWSLLQGIDKAKLFKIGKKNLLVWSEFKIDDVAKKNAKVE